MIEGQNLLEYLKEINNTKTEQNNETNSNNFKQQFSNSYLHLEGKYNARGALRYII